MDTYIPGRPLCLAAVEEKSGIRCRGGRHAGVGIGANTAIFGLLDQALLRSLPVKEPAQLVILKFSGSFNGHTRSRTDDKFYFSYPMYRDLRDRNSAFNGLIATVNAQAGVQWHNQPELVRAEVVSGNYFDVLGVRPALGRLLVQSDDAVPSANPVAVLSFDYWQRRFGADRNLLNQAILINGHPFTVVGVAQRGFHSAVAGDTPDLFAPMMMKAAVMPGGDELEERKANWLNIIGRRSRASAANRPKLAWGHCGMRFVPTNSSNASIVPSASWRAS